jgi:hypothetical protein
MRGASVAGKVLGRCEHADIMRQPRRCLAIDALVRRPADEVEH